MLPGLNRTANISSISKSFAHSTKMVTLNNCALLIGGKREPQKLK